MCIKRQGKKGGAMTFSLSPQCRAFSRAVMDVLFSHSCEPWLQITGA